MTDLYSRYPELAQCRADIDAALEALTEMYHKGGKLLLCGNGGSAADCEHIVGELMKSFILPRPVSAEQRAEMLQQSGPKTGDIFDKLQRGIPAISLPSQIAVSSAYCNDVDAELVYAQLVFGYGKKGDILLGLSTSGNSRNVAAAAEVARALGLKTIAMTGRSASVLSECCDICIRVPATETYMVQEYHLPVYHFLCAELERILFV